MSIFSREKKYEWINNSPFDHYFLKMQIWHQKWPMVIEKIFGIDMKYPLLMYSLGHLHVKNYKNIFFKEKFILSSIIED